MSRDYESFTSLDMYRRCPRQYRYRYLEKKKQPPKGALILGGSCHETLEEDAKHKVETEKNLRLDEVEDIFSDSFERKVEDAGGKSYVKWNGEQPGSIKDDGIQMINTFDPLRKKAKPKMVEQEFQLQLNTGEKIYGKIDRIDEDDTLVDYKTASQKKPKNAIDKSEQIELYQMAYPQLSKVKLEVLGRRKNKGPNTYFTQELESPPVSKHRIKIIKEDIRDILAAIKKGIFPRASKANWMCDPKWCGFYDSCRGKK